ncbi:MAG: hypothetical protein WDN30_09760 [Pararobbsia sp.]
MNSDDTRARLHTKGHVQLNIDNIDDVTIYEGELYWKGRKLKVAGRLELTWPEKIVAIAIAVGTLAAPIATYFQGLESLCKFTGNNAPLCSKLAVPQKPSDTNNYQKKDGT